MLTFSKFGIIVSERRGVRRKEIIMKVYVASSAKEGGVYEYDYDGGKLRINKITRFANPMFLALCGDKMHAVFGVDGNIRAEGSYGVFSLGKDGLEPIGKAISTKGCVPCHLSVDGGQAYAVNYISGSAVRLPDGKLVAHEGKGVNLPRQDAPHTHMALLSPDKKLVYVTDLGLDTVFVYDRDLNELSTARVPDGYGARHMAISPDGKYLYCVNELVSSVSVFRVDGEKLVYVNTVLCPIDTTETNTAGAIRISKDGKTLYISNRGENTIVAFAVDGANLTLKQKVDCRGNFPRDFDVTPDGKYLICCNQKTNDLTVFSVEPDGTLTYSYTVLGIENPLCVVFDE